MKLVGLSCAVPRKVVPSSLAYEKFPQADVDRIVKNVGALRHREAEPGTTAGDLALTAASALLTKLDWDPKLIDGILFVSQSPDYLIPGTSHRIQAALKLSEHCLCLDLNLGCSGFTHGIIVLRGLIASATLKRALLLCGEVTTGTIRKGVADVVDHHELGNALTFGDGGSAVAFEAGSPTQYAGATWGADGTQLSLINIPGGGFREFVCAASLERTPDAEGNLRRPVDLRVNSPALFTFTLKHMPSLVDETMKAANWSRENVDYWLFYQSNKFIIDFLVKRLKIPPDKVPLSIQDYGNTSSASIPLTMLTQLGDRLQKPAKHAMFGFGPGLSWSGVAFETDRVALVPLIEV